MFDLKLNKEVDKEKSKGHNKSCSVGHQVNGDIINPNNEMRRKTKFENMVFYVLSFRGL